METTTTTTTTDRPGASASAPNGVARDARPGDTRQRTGMDPLFGVRTADIEPYTGLRYLSKLFRMIAIILLLMLVAEVVTGLVRQGTESIPTLVAEVSRLVVLAGLLWGVGDLVLLLIDLGHDVRAARIFLGRQVSHPASGGAPSPVSSGSATSSTSTVRETLATPSAGV